jgi:hypothetical protein
MGGCREVYDDGKWEDVGKYSMTTYTYATIARQAHNTHTHSHTLSLARRGGSLQLIHRSFLSLARRGGSSWEDVGCNDTMYRYRGTAVRRTLLCMTSPIVLYCIVTARATSGLALRMIHLHDDV